MKAVQKEVLEEMEARQEEMKAAQKNQNGTLKQG